MVASVSLLTSFVFYPSFFLADDESLLSPSLVSRLTPLGCEGQVSHVIHSQGINPLSILRQMVQVKVESEKEDDPLVLISAKFWNE